MSKVLLIEVVKSQFQWGLGFKVNTQGENQHAQTTRQSLSSTKSKNPLNFVYSTTLKLEETKGGMERKLLCTC